VKLASRALVSLALAASALGASFAATAQMPLPKFEAYVTDLTGTLTAAQQASLEEKLTTFQRRKGAQVAVLILPTTQPEDIAQFGVRLAEAWKIGRKGIDDGAILIVAKDDKALRIETQYGLEGALTDALAGRIINDTIVPLFKQGDFYGGVNAGVDQMIRVVDGEPLPDPDPQWKPGGATPSLPFLLFAGFAVASVLRSLIGRGPAALLAGVGGGGITWWITSKLLFAGAVGVGAFLFVLLMGFGGGFGGGRGGRVFRDIGRGGFGGFGGGGFGGGGFGGGMGGMGGGGGASGRW
jgi:uncharacterized protein